MRRLCCRCPCHAVLSTPLAGDAGGAVSRPRPDDHSLTAPVDARRPRPVRAFSFLRSSSRLRLRLVHLSCFRFLCRPLFRWLCSNISRVSSTRCVLLWILALCFCRCRCRYGGRHSGLFAACSALCLSPIFSLPQDPLAKRERPLPGKQSSGKGQAKERTLQQRTSAAMNCSFAWLLTRHFHEKIHRASPSRQRYKSTRRLFFWTRGRCFDGEEKGRAASLGVRHWGLRLLAR